RTTCCRGWWARPSRRSASPTTARSCARNDHDGGLPMPLLSEQSRRKRNLVLISGTLLVLAVVGALSLEMRAPELPVASNIVVFALFNLNLIVFLLLLVLLCRNLVKLWFERRQQVIGSKFKTKLVFAFLSLALTPAILIFI